MKARSMRKPLDVVPLRDEHLERAAGLVTACYREEQRTVPALPVRYEDPGEVLPLLRDASKRSRGVIAIRDDNVEGFLLGGAFFEYMGQCSVYVPELLHASCVDGRQETYRQMYAHLSRKWVEDGCCTHIITLFAHDHEAIDAFFWMGFGLTNVDAIRDMSPIEGGRAGVEIHRAGREDAEVITAFDTRLQRYLTMAPTFHYEEPLVAESWLANPANSAWLAYRDGTPVGCIRIGPSTPRTARFTRDERAAYIEHAFVEEGLRNAGIGTALLGRAMDWARSKGFERCAVDFESANATARNFWLKHFQPVCLILCRCVDERMARAQGH